MKITPFFVDLHAAYLAELDDLSLDSEQNNVLARRLADKRQQMPFLVQMMELSPEMVAVVFHHAFEFRLPAVMDDLLGQQAENFPQWARNIYKAQNIKGYLYLNDLPNSI